MNKPSIFATTLTFALFSAFVSAQNYQIDVPWVTHLQAGMVEQDVFIEKETGAGEVWRVTTETYEQYLDMPAYTTAAPTTHDPFNPGAVGPYPKGKALDMTLGEWLAGTGDTTVRCENGQGTVQASFTNLVPDGVYTVWHFYTPMPPTVPFLAIELPLGARDGSQNTFTADANGNALYTATFEPCLTLSTEQLLSALAIAYHSDGKTYGMDPGNFGSVSHVQLAAMFPTEAEAKADQ
jgi:hypothetical protein